MKKFFPLAYFLIFLLTTASAQDQPNIIWLMAEDIGPDIECYGMQAVKTPNLNKMAAEGVKFEHCYVTNPICSPSRSAMMVGTHQNKINAHHHRSNRDVPLNEEYKPFTYWLRQAGYTTILGHHSVMGKGRKTDVNFKHEKIGEWDGKTKFGLFDKYDHFEKEDQPFFAQIQLQVTHRGDWWDDVRSKSKHPVDPEKVVLPPYMADHPAIRLDWAKYLDQMEYMDNEVGMIFEELRKKDMIDNTVVIFIGDNGRCNVKGKGYLHDPGLHIPLIIYYPKTLKGGQVKKEVVSATDITATILDFAGIPVPDYMTGKVIFDENFKRKFSYGTRDLWDEVMEKSQALSSGKWKYIRNEMPEVPFDSHQAYLEFYRPAVHVMRAMKDRGALDPVQEFFFLPNKPAEELYDLESDPHEINNLADSTQHQIVLQRLRKRLDRFQKRMTPVDTTYHPVHPVSVDVFNWLVENKPQEYKRMLEGEEIGFKAMYNEYKKVKGEKK